MAVEDKLSTPKGQARAHLLPKLRSASSFATIDQAGCVWLSADLRTGKTRMPTPGLTMEMTAVLSELRRSAPGSPSLESLQQNIVETIAQRLPYYNWTGFYMLDPDDPQMLVLGPFVGDPTPHTRIPVSEGICGAAAASGETVIVDDVNADPRYLSCSIKTRSEIVVPIHANGKVIGEIDIDSHDIAAFAEIDRFFLEEIAGIVGAYVEGHAG